MIYDKGIAAQIKITVLKRSSVYKKCQTYSRYAYQYMDQ